MGRPLGFNQMAILRVLAGSDELLVWQVALLVRRRLEDSDDPRWCVSDEAVGRSLRRLADRGLTRARPSIAGRRWVITHVGRNALEEGTDA